MNIMMRLAVTVGFMVAYACPLGVRAQTQAVRIANIDYSLDPVQLRQLSIEGMDGDTAAAEKVMNYYVFIERKRRKSVFWSIIAAENGSSAGQFMAYQLLANSRKIDEQRRALFWLGKAAKNGYFGADIIYRVCNSISAKHTDIDKTPCFGPKSENVWPL